jgi:hypothetical protein
MLRKRIHISADDCFQHIYLPPLMHIKYTISTTCSYTFYSVIFLIITSKYARALDKQATGFCNGLKTGQKFIGEFVFISWKQNICVRIVLDTGVQKVQVEGLDEVRHPITE